MQLGRPLPPRQAVLLGERAPGGEVDQALALLDAERLELALARGAARQLEHGLQGRALRRPARVAVERVDGVRGLRRLGLPLQQLALGGGHVGDLGHRLDADVDRVDEAARRRQVRRRLHRADGLRGVQRVDEHEVGAEVGGAPDRQLGEVVEVAEAPRPARAHRVQLGHEAPAAALAGERGGQLEPLRRHHERAARGGGLTGRLDPGHEPVPAERQVGGHREGRLAHLRAVDHPRVDPVVLLRQLAPPAALELGPHLHRAAVRQVHRHPGRRARSRHHHRRQGAPPRTLLGLLERHLHRVVGRRVDSERRQHRHDRRRRAPARARPASSSTRSRRRTRGRGRPARGWAPVSAARRRSRWLSGLGAGLGGVRAGGATSDPAT